MIEIMVALAGCGGDEAMDGGRRKRGLMQPGARDGVLLCFTRNDQQQ